MSLLCYNETTVSISDIDSLLKWCKNRGCSQECLNEIQELCSANDNMIDDDVLQYALENTPGLYNYEWSETFTEDVIIFEYSTDPKYLEKMYNVDTKEGKL